MWVYLNTSAWALVGLLLMFVFIPSREGTGWINGGGFIIMIVAVARLAYLIGVNRAAKNKPDA